jgi:glycosyltransferase involved in cell wall biosynthesis
MIKIWLQYPWTFPDSPYYKYLIKNPPKGVKYLNIEKQKGVITSKKKFAYMNKLKNIVRKVMYVLKRPNIIRTKKGDYDIIQCAHCLSKNKTPWIVDFEKYWNLASSGKLAHSKKGKKIIRKFLKDPNCKKIIPWTEAAKKSLMAALKDKEIGKKTEVVYPAIPLPELKARKKKNKITLLFIGRYFYQKGGLHVLEVFDKITKKHPKVNCIFVSEVPQEILKKYSSNKKIKFYNLVPQDILFKHVYPKSDIFVYPGYSDTFGFALLEAMSFGLPVITVDGFARKEIISDGKNGFIIKKHKKMLLEDMQKKDEKMIKELIDKTSKLIKNPELLKKMSRNAREEIKSGKFSIKERNKKLDRVFKEALK